MKIIKTIFPFVLLLAIFLILLGYTVNADIFNFVESLLISILFISMLIIGGFNSYIEGLDDDIDTTEYVIDVLDAAIKREDELEKKRILVENAYMVLVNDNINGIDDAVGYLGEYLDD